MVGRKSSGTRWPLTLTSGVSCGVVRVISPRSRPETSVSPMLSMRRKAVTGTLSTDGTRVYSDTSAPGMCLSEATMAAPRPGQR